jgi:hypothetical protein
VNLSRVLALLRANWRGIVAEGAVNVVLPVLIYNYSRAALGDVRALLASSVPPVAWSIVTFARKRRFDVISIFVVAGIVLSLLAFIGGGSVRFLQLRENFVTGLFSLAFLVSAAIGRPLIYLLARATMSRRSPEEAAQFERLGENVYVRRSMTVMTLVWGFGLLAQTTLACVLVFVLSIRVYLVVSPILAYAMTGALGLWTFWYLRRQKQRGARSAPPPLSPLGMTEKQPER